MLKKRYRLVDDYLFRRLRQKGQRRYGGDLILSFLPNKLPYSRVGFIVSRRYGSAVKRNRIKRLLREALRLHWAQIIPGWDMVWVVRPSLPSSSLAEIEKKVIRLLQSAGLWRKML